MAEFPRAAEISENLRYEPGELVGRVCHNQQQPPVEPHTVVRTVMLCYVNRLAGSLSVHTFSLASSAPCRTCMSQVSSWAGSVIFSSSHQLNILQ